MEKKGLQTRNIVTDFGLFNIVYVSYSRYMIVRTPSFPRMRGWPPSWSPRSPRCSPPATLTGWRRCWSRQVRVANISRVTADNTRPVRIPHGVQLHPVSNREKLRAHTDWRTTRLKRLWNSFYTR